MFNQWEISADSIASPSVSVCLPPPPLFVHVFVSPCGIWLHVMVKVTFQEINDRAKQNKWPGVFVCEGIRLVDALHTKTT